MAAGRVIDRKFELRNKVREALESEFLTKENKDAVFISGLISGLWEFIEASESADEETGIHQKDSAGDYTSVASQDQLYKSILNSMDEGIISFSLPDYQPIYISKAIYSIFKRLPGEFPENIDLLTFCCYTDDKQALNNFINQLENKNQDELEYRIVLSDKQVKWVLIKARLVRDISGIAKRVDFTINDISDKKLFQHYTDRFSHTLLNLGLDFSENINSLTSLFGELFGATCALYNRMEEGMLCSVSQWAAPPDFNAKDKPEGHICYDVIKNSSNKMLLVRNLPETIYAETDPNVRPYKLKTYVGRAVFCDGEAVGSVCAVYQADFSPGIEHETLLNMIANGDLLWQKCIGGLGDEELSLNGVIDNGDGSYIIASTLRGNNSGDITCLITPPGGYDIWLIQLRDTTLVSSNHMPKPVYSVKAYPNPAKDYVLFELEKSLPSGTITITDILGREVAAMPVKGEKTVWVTEGVKPGVYLYKIAVSGNFKRGKILIK